MNNLKDKVLSTLRAIFGTYRDFWIEDTYPTALVHGFLLIVVVIAWLLWPVDVAPSKEFTEKQEAAKVEIQKDAAQGEQLTQQAQAVTREAENVSTRLETRKKGIVKAKEKANESEVKVDFVAHGDVSDVPGNAELCTRANQAGIRCDTDR